MKPGESQTDKKVNSIKEWREAVFPNQDGARKDDASRRSPIEAAVALSNRAVESLKDSHPES